MGNSINIAGIDPGFANIGYVIARLDTTKVVPIKASVFITEKSNKKRNVLASADNFRRAQEISVFLRQLIFENKISIICLESMSFPRNSSAAAKVAMFWGVLSAITEHLGIPVIQASPQEVKLALTAKKSATKEEVEEAVKKLYTVPKIQSIGSKENHAYDALAVITTCLDSEVIKLARTYLKG